MEDLKINEAKVLDSLLQLTTAYNSLFGLLEIYETQEKQIVKIQKKIKPFQFLPILNNQPLEAEKQKVSYDLPTTWKDTFKLIKLLWQTRQLA